MRKICAMILAMILCVLTMTSAMAAITFETRGRYYLYRTSADTEMYSDAEGTTSVGTLPGGTPISAGDTTENLRKVTYMDASGSTHSVYINKDVVKSNYVTLDFNGNKVRVPLPASANATWVAEYLEYRGISVSSTDIAKALGQYSESVTPAPVPDGEDYITQENDGLSMDGEEVTDAGDASEATAAPTAKKSSSSSSSKSSSKATVTAAPSVTSAPDSTGVVNSANVASVPADGKVYYLDGSNTLKPVTAVDIGLIFSTVSSGNQKYDVETSRLLWNTNADADHRLAMINAPKGGTANLRKTASSSAKVLAKAKTNRVVLVYDVQDKMSGVIYGDEKGYVNNSALTFFPATSSYQSAVLSYNGSLTSTKKINFYSQAKDSSRKLISLKAGMEVTLFEQGKYWSEVDVDGYHGYVSNKFIQLSAENTHLEPADITAQVVTVAAQSASASGDADDEAEDIYAPAAETSDGSYEPFYVNGYEMHHNPYN
ncbi:MAG: SH3 domain-containing protein [Clostridia bacterium]|nr:SH3 domain-containing protein [Clostridia bacterium]